jgi:mannose-6-phosphate isomerase-like protein (cupin superfamily)
VKVRRVVTGHNEAGRAVFVDDRELDSFGVSLIPGAEYHRLWGGNETPSFPDDGAPRPTDPYFPPVGGYRFSIFQLPPGQGQTAVPPPVDLERALAEMEERLPGARAYFEPDAPGMHTTATIDFSVVLEGEVCLELDDGAEVVLKPGDTVVQNGTRHRWRNKGEVPVRLVAFIIGAYHANVPTRG